MAKRSKTLPVRATRTTDSILLETARSLGRTIAALQRQLDEMTRAPAADGKSTTSSRSPKSRTSAKSTTSAKNSRSRRGPRSGRGKPSP